MTVTPESIERCLAQVQRFDMAPDHGCWGDEPHYDASVPRSHAVANLVTNHRGLCAYHESEIITGRPVVPIEVATPAQAVEAVRKVRTPLGHSREMVGAYHRWVAL